MSCLNNMFWSYYLNGPKLVTQRRRDDATSGLAVPSCDCHCKFPTKLEVSRVASGCRNCPFTIIKQNGKHTTNTDSISRCQWSNCV